MWWTRSYKIIVLRNGRQIPVIDISPKKYEHISYIFHRDWAKRDNVVALLKKIKELKSPEIIEIEAEDKCELVVHDNLVIVKSPFEEFDSFEIPKKELIVLVEEWADFLTEYEEGRIPNIIPENLKDKLIIAPISAIKNGYL